MLPMYYHQYVSVYYPYAPFYWPMSPVQPAPQKLHSSDLLQNTLHICLPYFELLDVAPVSCCNKGIAQTCKDQLTAGGNYLAHQLLQTAVTDAAAIDPAPSGAGSRQRKQAAEKYLQQFKRAVPWLVGFLGSNTLFSTDGPHSTMQSATADILVHTGTPIVPQDVAVRLVQAGLRVSYSQLVSAARARVAGIEIWGRAMEECGVWSDIPEYAKSATLCTWKWFPSIWLKSEDNMPYNSMSGQELGDYLVLFLNGLSKYDRPYPEARQKQGHHPQPFHWLECMMRRDESSTVAQKLSTDNICSSCWPSILTQKTAIGTQQRHGIGCARRLLLLVSQCSR